MTWKLRTTPRYVNEVDEASGMDDESVRDWLWEHYAANRNLTAEALAKAARAAECRKGVRFNARTTAWYEAEAAGMMRQVELDLDDPDGLSEVDCQACQGTGIGGDGPDSTCRVCGGAGYRLES